MTDESVIADFPATAHDHDECVDGAIAAAEALCEEAGVRLTALRRRVLELVWSSHTPLGAYEILEMLRTERGGAAPPTVYRALDFLLEQGLIHRIESLNAFVGCAHPEHSHGGQFLICTQCGLTAELDDNTLSRRLRDRAARLGFVVESQMVEVKGLCPACAKAGA